jgi:hypothetical protein
VVRRRLTISATVFLLSPTSGRSGMDSAEPAAGDLVQRAEDQPALRQAGVNCGDAERHNTRSRPTGLLDTGNPDAQLVENTCRGGRHIFPDGELQGMFLFCSLMLHMSTPTRVSAEQALCRVAS